MNAPSVDIANLLESEGLGVFGGISGWCIYIGTEPSKPDTTVTLYDTTGAEPDYAAAIEYPAIQVRVRGSPYGYPAAYERAKDVRDLLIATNGVMLGGATYSAWIMGDVAYLATDESQRPIFVANYRLMRSEA